MVNVKGLQRSQAGQRWREVLMQVAFVGFWETYSLVLSMLGRHGRVGQMSRSVIELMPWEAPLDVCVETRSYANRTGPPERKILH